MRLVDDFDNATIDEGEVILITTKEIADLRYSIIDDEGGKRLIPLRWRSFALSGAVTDVYATFDRQVADFIGMTVRFDHFNRETSVELVDEHTSTRHANWDMSSDTREDLLNAVRFLMTLSPHTGSVLEWRVGS